LPLQSLRENLAAAVDTSESGTQSQTTAASSKASDEVRALAPSFRASLVAVASERRLFRETISVIRQPLLASRLAKTVPSRPGPTIAIEVRFIAARISGGMRKKRLAANSSASVPYIVWMAKSKSLTKARVLSSRIVYRGPVFWVTTDEVIEPTGVQVRRDVVRHSGSIVVLAVDDNAAEPRVLLEKQYRHAAGRFLYELPAGRIDEGEKELNAAKRELLEETGYSARSWKRILRFWASPGFVAEAMSIYLARGLKAGTAQPEDDEVIEIQFVPLKKAVAMVVKGTIQDAKTIAGVLWLDWQSRAVSRTKRKSRLA
jgi:ADP-ribose pyrophosphatase